MTRLQWPLLRGFALAALLLVTGALQAQALAPIPALDSPVVDTTSSLDATTRDALVAQALALQQRKGSQLQVLLVPATAPEDIAAYSQRVFDQWKLGRKDVGDAVLVVVAKDEHRARIQTGYGLEGAIPDATAARVIQEYMAPKFRNGDYAGGLVDATAVLVKLVDGEPLPPPLATDRASGEGGNWPFALFMALIIAQFARGLFRRAPSPLRGLLGAGIAGAAAWLIAHAVLIGGIGAVLGFLVGMTRTPSGRYAGHGGWGGFGGGGGWGGGGGFGGGGGWSGGGGMSGGGGASGSW